MDYNAIFAPSVGSINFIFFLLIPTCLALAPANQTITASATSGQLSLSEINNTYTGDLILPSPSLTAPPSIAAGPYASAPPTFLRREVSASAKSSHSIAIIVVVMLVAFFLMGVLSMYIRRSCAVDGTDRNLHTVNYISHSNGSFYNGNLSVPFAVRQQLRFGEDNRPPPHGLDLLLVSSLPTLKFSRGKFKAFEAAETEKMVAECAVCLNEFEEGEELRFLPKCEHSFHQECIDMWLFSHTTCPLCRRSLLYDTRDRDEGCRCSGLNDHARPTMNSEPLADNAGPPQAVNGDVHEPFSDVQPFGYLGDSRRTSVVSPLDPHDVPRQQPYTMRRSHSTDHLYLYVYPPPPSSSSTQSRNQLDILPATTNAHGRKSGCATWSRPPPHNKLGCATWIRPMPGSELGCATCVRPTHGSQLGDAGWNSPSRLDRATWSRPMPGNKSGRATVQNPAKSSNESSCATWSPPAPYHKAHSCNVLLDLQAMRRALQDASPS